MNPLQLRLLPPPKPLRERLGNEFFRRVPRSPGVYVMSGEADRVLYVGQSGNLRHRLNSYKNLHPERASRKLVRLVHAVRAITWETCATPHAARLRENELLRLHRPRFNSMNVAPEHHPFVALRCADGRVEIRLTRQPLARPGERLFGAFKGLSRTRRAAAALLRSLHAAAHPGRQLADFPRELLRDAIAVAGGVRLPLAEAGADLGARLRDFFAGDSDALLAWLEAACVTAPEVAPFQQAFRAADLETLREFFTFGPARNRAFTDAGGAPALLAPAELDDLLAAAARAPRPQQGPMPGAAVVDEGVRVAVRAQVCR